MEFSRVPVRNGTSLLKESKFLPGTSRKNIYHMIEQSSPGKARNILVAYCRRKEYRGIRSIARELVRPYSTIRDWFVWMAQRDLGERFDRKSTGKARILGQLTLKKIMEWTHGIPRSMGLGRRRDVWTW